MRHLIAAAATAAPLALAPGAVLAQDMQLSVRTSQDVRRCEDLEVTFGGRPAVTAVDRLTAPGAGKLTVQAARNGGISVYGGTGRDFAISVCKAAAPDAAGGGALQQVRASLAGGTLTATGPGSGGWVVHFIVEAPRQGDIALEATNGPIHAEHLAGATTVRSQNGPVKLLDLGGRVSARTRNGPIAYQGGGGTVDLDAENGPVDVRLAGTQWAGGALTARAQNGPVKLQAPQGFSSGVRVRSSPHSPWRCRGCDDTRRTWDDASRVVEFGSGPVAVTLTTVNGPVAVDLTK